MRGGGGEGSDRRIDGDPGFVVRGLAAAADARDTAGRVAAEVGLWWRVALPVLVWLAIAFTSLYWAAMLFLGPATVGQAMCVAIIWWLAAWVMPGPRGYLGAHRTPVGAGPQAYVVGGLGATAFVLALLRADLAPQQWVATGVLLVVVGGWRYAVRHRLVARRAAEDQARREYAMAMETGDALADVRWPNGAGGPSRLRQAAVGAVAGGMGAVRRDRIPVSTVVGTIALLPILAMIAVVVVAMGLGKVTGLGAWATAGAVVVAGLVGGRLAAWAPAPGAPRRRSALRARVDAHRYGSPVTGSAAHQAPDASMTTFCDTAPDTGVPATRASGNSESAEEVPVTAEDLALVDALLVATDVPGWLEDQGIPVSIPVGVDPSTGRWRGVGPHLAVVASSGSGKTRRVIAPVVLAHQGPVITSSTKPDLGEMTTAVRRTHGTVWWWDPAGSLPVPEGAVVARWSPLTLVHDRDSALKVAERLVAAGGIASGGTDAGRFFADQASEVLAPLMLAAVLHKGGAVGAMSILQEWLAVGPTGDDGWADAEAALANAGEITLAATIARCRDDANRGDGRLMQSTLATARQILAAYRRERTTLEADEPNLDLRALVASQGDTLHIGVTAEEARAIGGLLGLLLDAAVEARRSIPERQREASGDLLLALDELARCPVTGLAAYLSEARGFGVRVIGGLQSMEQLDRWPEGRALKALWPHILIFRNTSDAMLLREVSEFAGEGITMRETYSAPVRTVGTIYRAAASQGMAGHDPTRSWAEQTERHLKVNEVAGAIPDGHVRLITGREPAGLYAVPDIDEGPWKVLRDACQTRWAYEAETGTDVGSVRATLPI